MNIGARIKLARARAGLSGRQLASRVGVSATAISKFERGETMPRQSTLLQIARALAVGVEFFFRDVKVEVVCPAYRKKSSLSAYGKLAVEGTITETLERYLTAEQLFTNEEPKALPTWTVNTLEDVEQAADDLRRTWSLGLHPIDDLCGTLENSGVKVIAVAGPPEFDGYSCWVNETIPAVVFNSQSPGDRQRFDMAHELGHLVLLAAETLDGEKAAHRFAAAFLVPARKVFDELGNRRTNLGFDELLLLKKKYRVSVQVWIRRAYDSGVIEESTYSALFRRLSAQGWRSKEPEPIPPEEPERLKLLVYRALAEKLITPSYAATLLDEKPQPSGVERPLREAPPSLVKEYTSNKELTASADLDLEVLREDDH